MEAREHLRRGLELSRQELYAGAAAELRAYLRTYPDDAQAHEQLGRALLQQARQGASSREEAVDELRRAAALAPDKEPIKLQLAEALGERAGPTYRPDEALALYEQVLAADPQNYEVHLVVGAWLLESDIPGRNERARDHLDRVLDLAPEGSAALERARALRAGLDRR